MQNDLRQLYVAQLLDLASMERQVRGEFERMAAAVPQFVREDFFNRHQHETVRQEQRLITLLLKYGANVMLHNDRTVQALIHAFALSAESTGTELLSHAVRLQKYEIGSYQRAAALAQELEFEDDERLLNQSLNEEQAAHCGLAKLAKF